MNYYIYGSETNSHGVKKAVRRKINDPALYNIAQNYNYANEKKMYLIHDNKLDVRNAGGLIEELVKDNPNWELLEPEKIETEPKFKVGQWVVYQGGIFRVENVLTDKRYRWAYYLSGDHRVDAGALKEIDCTITIPSIETQELDLEYGLEDYIMSRDGKV